MAFLPIPSMLLKQLYTNSSLKNTDGGVMFSLKNRLTDVQFSELISIEINGQDVPVDKIAVDGVIRQPLIELDLARGHKGTIGRS